MRARTRPFSCIDCSKPLRHAQTKIADAPGTAPHGARGRCQKCQRIAGDWTNNRRPSHCRRCNRGLTIANHSGRGICKSCKGIENNLKRTYNLTLDQWKAMLVSQCGRCAACNDPMTRALGPVVDHNHITGEVRALLCRNCNVAEGLLDRSPDKARALATYMESHA